MVTSMKYIEKVILENFQSHKNTTITFDNQLNVIVGPSDSGKTAILRGIKWALYNEPSGDYFIRQGESHCSVTIIFSDSTKIKRYRSKSKNSYHLYDSYNNEEVFEGFGTSVPREIIEKTGIEKILLDSDTSVSINISDQLEGPFLLSQRGSVRASSIGRLVGVDLIDESLRETLRDVRNLSIEERNANNLVVELEKELEEYEYLKELERKINSLDLLKNEILEKEKTKKTYEEKFKKINILLENKKNAKKYIEKLKNISNIDDLILNILNKINNFNYMLNKKNHYLNLMKDIESNKEILSSFKDINLMENIINDLSLNLTLKQNIRILKQKFNKTIEESNILKDSLELLNKLDCTINIVKEIELYNKNLVELNNINKRNSSLKSSLKIGIDYLEKLKTTDEIELLYGSLNRKVDLLDKLNSIKLKYNKNNNEINKTKSFLKNHTKSFKETLYEYENFLQNQDFCPFCFSEISNDKIKHIISHYI